MRITTENLYLIPLTLLEFETLLTSKEKLTEALKLSKDLEPLNKEMTIAFEWLCKQCKNLPEYHIWYTAWLIVTKADNTPIGSFCFKGEPTFNGEIEIGYGIYPTYQKHGYMSETLSALADWLIKNEKIKALIAETDESNIQSQNVLIKNGFIKYSERDNMFWWRKKLQ